MNSFSSPKLLFPVLAFFCGPIMFGQSIFGTLIDKSSQETIPFATVQLGENYGVITNQEGNFNINVEGFTQNDSLVFSSMGYERKSVALKDFKSNDTIYLAKNVEELGQVLLMNKDLTAEEIMAKVNENLEKNYDNSLLKSTVFHREEVGNKFYKMGFEIKKAEFIQKKQLKEFNKSVDSLLSSFKNQTSRSFFSNLSEVLVGKNDSLPKDTLKVKVVKATHLVNEEKSIDTDKLQEKVMKTLLEKLKTSNTFKLRTSILTLEDSLDLSEIDMKEEVDSIKPASIRNQLGWLLRKTRDKENFDFITDYDDYEFTIEKISIFNDEPIYVLSFVPATGLFSGNGKYAGTLFVSADSFAVVKIDYRFAEGEHGQRLNLKFLLGVKYEQKGNSGTIIFQKNENGKYSPKYIQSSEKAYGYFSRKFVLKENDKRKDRMKLKFDVTMELDFDQNSEWVFLNTQPISNEEFSNFEENDGIVEETIEKYDPKIWEKYNVLAPTKAIREYEY